MNKKTSILLAFLLLSFYHLPPVKQFFKATTAKIWSSNITISVTSEEDQQNRIQLALLLDTSNSMDGLIEQAKSQLWKMVNELAESTKDGRTPEIEIALYEYGNDQLSPRKGYIREVVPLTTDLDLVSEKLFELKTDGGEEYCGFALKTAIENLTWSNKSDNLKIVFIAGNESFDQGPVLYQDITKAAKKNDILINTIFCGDYQKGIREYWKTGADLGGGQYMVINHNDQVQHIETPYDKAIVQLNLDLNETYLAYGEEGESKVQRQMLQDSNAGYYGLANARTRASFKSKSSYKNTEWDVVDAVDADESFLEENEIQLPAKLKDMSKAERKEYVANLKSTRENIQKQILELDKKSKAYIVEQKRKTAKKNTLDEVLINTVKKQAEAKNFEF